MIKKFTQTFLFLMISTFCVGCSLFHIKTPEDLFGNLNWDMETVILDHFMHTSFPLGDGKTVVVENEIIGEDLYEHSIALWSGDERTGEFQVSHPIQWVNGAYLFSDSIYVTYHTTSDFACFAKFDPVALTETFSTLFPEEDPSLTFVCFPYEAGYVAVWGSASEQSWASLDRDGTLIETNQTSFTLPHNANRAYNITCSKTLVIGETTYVNFSGNLFAYEHGVASLLDTPEVLGFPDEADTLSYYYRNVRSQTKQSDFILYLFTGNTETSVVHIKSTYLLRIMLGMQEFVFTGNRVYVTGSRTASSFLPNFCLLIYDQTTDQTYWSEFPGDHEIYLDEYCFLIDDSFYWNISSLQYPPHQYQRAKIPTLD